MLQLYIVSCRCVQFVTSEEDEDEEMKEAAGIE